MSYLEFKCEFRKLFHVVKNYPAQCDEKKTLQTIFSAIYNNGVDNIKKGINSHYKNKKLLWLMHSEIQN